MFKFDPTGSEKANAFLRDRAEHLPTLTRDGQRVFLKTALAFARKLPLTADENAMVKSQVILTLHGWLDEVASEVAA